MRIDFSIPASSVEGTRQTLKAEQQGFTVGLNRVCYSQVTLNDLDGGNTLILDDVPFLYLVASIKNFITQNSNKPSARERICDPDQTYEIDLLKESELLKLTSWAYREARTINVRCPRKAHELDYVVANFVNEYIQLCPELASHSLMDTLRKEFKMPFQVGDL